MRTHGHREGSMTHWGLLGEIGKRQWGVRSWGQMAWGEMPGIGDGRKAANHTAANHYATILHVLHMYPQT